MLKFSTYLTEEFLIEKRKAELELKSPEDAKGKLFEILTGSYMMHGANKKTGLPNQFLEHYRDEDGFRPVDVHNKIKAALSKLSPGMYEEVVKHSQQASQHLLEQLKQRNIHNVQRLAWTSQKGDHERFTGVDDPNSDADLMIDGSDHKGRKVAPVGLSMKYGKQKDPNLRGNGLDALEQIAGLKSGELEKLRNQHYEHIRNQGVSSGKAGDAEYKDLAARGHKKAKSIDEHALQTQQEMSRRFTKGLSKLSSDRLNDAIKTIIAPQTKFLHIRHHTQVNDSGAVNHETHDVQDHAGDVLNSYEEFRVRPHTGGISTVIEGRRKGASGFETAMQIGIKKSRTFSGRGFNSFTKAPMLRTSRKTKASRTIAEPQTAPAVKPVKQKKVADAPVVKPTKTKSPQPAPSSTYDSSHGGKKWSPL